MEETMNHHDEKSAATTTTTTTDTKHNHNTNKSSSERQHPSLESFHSFSDDDDDDSHTERSSRSGGAVRKQKACALSKEQEDEIAKRESKAVFHLRLMVFAILIFTAVVVSLLIYRVTSDSEQAEFESQFQAVGEKIESAFQNIVSRRIGDIGALAVATIAQGVDQERSDEHDQSSQKWPFVTLTSFQQRARKAMLSSKVLFTTIAPLVKEEEQVEWENYVLGENSGWIDQGIRYQEEYGLNDILPEPLERPFIYKDDWEPPNDHGRFPIFYLDERNGEAVDTSHGPFLPSWQSSPVLKRSWVNRNLLRDVRMREETLATLTLGGVIMGGLDYAEPGGVDSPDYYTAFYASILSVAERKATEYQGDPMGNIYIPIFNSFNATTAESRETVAVLVATVNWGLYFQNVLPAGFNGIDVILSDSCDGTYTYNIHGKDVILRGKGDHHERVAKYENMAMHSGFEDGTRIEDGTMAGLYLNKRFCNFTATIYPTKEFEETFTSSMPVMTTVAVTSVFVFTIFMFICYDRLVERRQKLVLSEALKSSAIVSSLFPKHIQEMLMQDEDGKGKKPNTFHSDNTNAKSFTEDGNLDPKKAVQNRKAIADLYPDTTVCFADLAGFTAWSSTREPEQVFTLLQTLYHEFDKLAQRRKVFKVETIGDCYMAATGLPEPQRDHAVRMAKFASDCLINMNKLVRELETTLGPDTAELAIRVGMHSGQVTAGVLRGDRARFQLFGDTVNTASRMESTGKRNHIQLSPTTAELLVAAGKQHWLKPREDKVEAKGKGSMTTYWLTKVASKPGSLHSSSMHSSKQSSEVSPEDQNALLQSIKTLPADTKKKRSVDWVCEMLQEKIKLVVVCRDPKSNKETLQQEKYSTIVPPKTTPFDEIVESIDIPKCKKAEVISHDELRHVTLDPIVKQQLHEYVTIVASTYRNNPFHNFDHACHVTMSVNKLFSRISTPDEDEDSLHAYTHSLKSDPITILAIVFSGVIHDADHRGCSNVQLIKEETDMGSHYKNKSVAEQNSLDLAWNLLMADQFKDLRHCMFKTEEELHRFRQVVVNIVLATDIFDKELVALRKRRWENAFSQEENMIESIHNLRATIVMEHIIQASDIAHTMQHWHIYRKWNEKLFTELHYAYKAGRMGADPATFWYKGEIGFFDNYVIPLAMKLKECQVFGVSSDEYLSYARENRSEWVDRGEEIVAKMVENLNSADGGDETNI